MQSSDKMSLQVPEAENSAYYYLSYRYYKDYKSFLHSIALDKHQYDLKYSYYCYPAKQRMALLSSLSVSYTRWLASLQLKPIQPWNSTMITSINQKLPSFPLHIKLTPTQISFQEVSWFFHFTLILKHRFTSIALSLVTDG